MNRLSFEKDVYRIIQEDLGDFEVFLKAVKQILLTPGDFNLTLD